jgi:hypothetical protein
MVQKVKFNEAAMKKYEEDQKEYEKLFGEVSPSTLLA